MPLPRKTSLQAEIELAVGRPIDEVIRQTLRRTQEKQLACAELGDIARTTLDRWLEQFGIDADTEIAIGKLRSRGLIDEVA